MITLHIRGLLSAAVLAAAATIPVATADPTAAAAAPIAVDLRQFVSDFTARIPLAGDGGYQAPTAAQYATLQQAVTAVQAGDLVTADSVLDSLDYDVQQLTDTATGRTVAALVERHTGISWPHAWGLYLVDTARTAEPVIEVPHPRADRTTESMAVDAFRDARAGALLVAGAHRNATADADVAHQSGSAFQAVHEVLSTTKRWVVQVHGFAATGHPGVGDVVVSNGTTTGNRAVTAEEAALADAGFTVCVYGVTNCSNLGATQNVQGQFTRAHGGLFVHLEVSSLIRSNVDQSRKAMRAAARGLRGKLALTSPLTIDNGVATFAVRNRGGRTVNVTTFVAGNRDAAGANLDFPATGPHRIAPGRRYVYGASRALPDGSYTAWAAYQSPAGVWYEFGRRLSYTVPDGGCRPPFGSFGPGTWPAACWRPYAASSPFNTPLPPNPRLLANSERIVSRVLGDISRNNQPANLVAHKDGSSGEPTYYSQPGDPVFTIQCIVYTPCPSGVQQIRIPAQAIPEGGFAARLTDDRHITVVDQAARLEYDLWRVQATGPLSPHGGTLQVGYAGATPLDGDGTSSDGTGTAAHFGNLAGRLRAEELAAGHIEHALFIDVDCDSGTHVFPAQHAGRSCAALGLSTTDAPPMGARFRLNMTSAEIDALPAPSWKKTILHALADYGAFVGDTGSSFYFTIETESGNQYSAFGAQDRWQQLAIANGWPSVTATTDYPYDHYLGSWRTSADGVNWTAIWQRLQVVDPCVSAQTC